MTSPHPLNRRQGSGGRLPPAVHLELARRRGGFISLPRKLKPTTPMESRGTVWRLTKLLLNVNVQGSVGLVQVVMSSENSVGDLLKAAIEIYAKEMRRPPLTETDSQQFELHYSQFSLESLKTEEKLINLGSRNFYLCQKQQPSNLANSSCSDEAKEVSKSAFHFIKFMDFLL